MEDLGVEDQVVGGAEDADEEAEGRESPEGTGEEVGESVAADAVDGEAAALDAGEDEGGESEGAELQDAGDEGVVGGDVGYGLGLGCVRLDVVEDAG